MYKILNMGQIPSARSKQITDQIVVLSLPKTSFHVYERLVERVLNAASMMPRQLRSDEDLLKRDTTFLDGLSNNFYSSIRVCGVDVSVTNLRNCNIDWTIVSLTLAATHL